MKRWFLILLTVITLIATATACHSKADVVSRNLSKDADNFMVLRRIVFYNGITGEYMLTITGYCSLGNYDGPKELSVTCRTGPEQYKKHFLGLSDNVTYFEEQINPVGVSADHYEIVFRPTTIIPQPLIR